MIWQKIVRLSMKIVIAFITLSVALTSIVGGISMILIVSDIENNIQIDQSGLQANFGAAGNNISIPMNFTNEGYFSFENFTVSLKIEMENKTSALNIVFLDSILYQNTLEGNTSYQIDIVATGENFINQSLLDDMGGSWNDPEVDDLIGDPVNETIELWLRPLSFPYILNAYDFNITVGISSSYNLGLINFGLDFEFMGTYYDYFSTSYAQLKQILKDYYGL